jgi:hypothetical protein
MMVAYWSCKVFQNSTFLLRPLECSRCEGRRIGDTSLLEVALFGELDHPMRMRASSISRTELPKRRFILQSHSIDEVGADGKGSF